MGEPMTVTYETSGRIARLTLNRPHRGNAITLTMAAEIAEHVERANLDPRVHVIALAGRGKGFCAGYDLVESAEGTMDSEAEGSGSPLDPEVLRANHTPGAVWDPMVDFGMMSRNVRGFMSLFHGEKPVICKVHGFCVGGGTDLALCSDLLVVESTAKIGFPPARVWGSPTTALWVYRVGLERTKRLLLTGDSLSGTEAVEWGLASEAAPPDGLDERFERLLERVARLPVNQLMMMKLLVNQTLLAQGLPAIQTLGTLLDGMARHTREGYAFRQRMTEVGFKQAVRERDEPFGDLGRSTSRE
jgi:enoyl-CoA hydratase